MDKRERFIRFAHQAGGPLQAIRSDAGYLLELLKTEGICKDAQEYLEAIDTSAARLGVILDNLLYANLPDLNHYLFHPDKISKAIKGAVYPFKYVAQHRGIEVRIDESIDSLPELEFDRYAMFNVFANLIDNAIKFSHSGKLVEIAGRKEDSSINITISNEGLEIVEEEQEEIFKPYYRGLRSDRPGCGLGLFAVKKIIEDHNGKVFVTSKEGKTIFTVRLPLQLPTCLIL